KGNSCLQMLLRPPEVATRKDQSRSSRVECSWKLRCELKSRIQVDQCTLPVRLVELREGLAVTFIGCWIGRIRDDGIKERSISGFLVDLFESAWPAGNGCLHMPPAAVGVYRRSLIALERQELHRLCQNMRGAMAQKSVAKLIWIGRWIGVKGK